MNVAIFGYSGFIGSHISKELGKINNIFKIGVRNITYNTSEKEIANVTFVGLRDLLGYEIYRDNSMIDYTEATEFLDSEEFWLEKHGYDL